MMNAWKTEVARKRLELVGNWPAVAPPPGVILRRGRREDHEGLKELTKVTMKGTDFVASYYMRYLEEPNRYVYVAEKDGQIIGCIMHHVVDAGRTIFSAGGRRDPAYKGQTVYQALTHHAHVGTLAARPAVEKARASTPSVQFYLNRTHSNPFCRVLPGAQKYYITMAYSVQSGDVASVNNPKVLNALAKQNVDKEQVDFASKDDLTRIFTDSSLRQQAFPADCLQAGFDMFEPRVENLQALFQDYRDFTVSKDLLSVAAYQFWSSQIGVAFNCKLHGKASAEMAIAHFLRLAERVVEHCPAGKALSFFYAIPKIISKEKVLQLCKILPCYQQKNTDYFDEMIGYETLIPPLHQL